MHLLGQAAHIMMALNHLAGNIQTLNTVRIDCTLSQPLGIGNFLRLSIKHFHKVTADNFTLLLRV